MKIPRYYYIEKKDSADLDFFRNLKQKYNAYVSFQRVIDNGKAVVAFIVYEFTDEDDPAIISEFSEKEKLLMHRCIDQDVFEKIAYNDELKAIRQNLKNKEKVDQRRWDQTRKTKSSRLNCRLAPEIKMILEQLRTVDGQLILTEKDVVTTLILSAAGKTPVDTLRRCEKQNDYNQVVLYFFEQELLPFTEMVNTFAKKMNFKNSDVISVFEEFIKSNPVEIIEKIEKLAVKIIEEFSIHDFERYYEKEIKKALSNTYNNFRQMQEHLTKKDLMDQMSLEKYMSNEDAIKQLLSEWNSLIGTVREGGIIYVSNSSAGNKVNRQSTTTS